MDETRRLQIQARISQLLASLRDQLRQKNFQKAEELAREASQLKQILTSSRRRSVQAPHGQAISKAS
jgi:hypothetical protein